MLAKLESFHEGFVLLGDRALVRLKRYDPVRFKIPVRFVKEFGIPSEVEVFLKGLRFRARIDGSGRICLPAYLREVLGDELWVWVRREDGGYRLIEYREDPQLKLDEFEQTPFKPVPACRMPRYGRGMGWCSRCGLAYPPEFKTCPRCGTKLRSRPRNKRGSHGVH